MHKVVDLYRHHKTTPIHFERIEPLPVVFSDHGAAQVHRETLLLRSSWSASPKGFLRLHQSLRVEQVENSDSLVQMIGRLRVPCRMAALVKCMADGVVRRSTCRQGDIGAAIKFTI